MILRTARRAAAIAALATLALAGCQDESALPGPVVAPLPARSDWLVDKMPGVSPAGREPLGTYPLDVLSRPGWESDPNLAEFKKAVAEGVWGIIDTRALAPGYRQATEDGLTKLFGPAGSPRLEGIDPAAEAELRLSPATLAAGARLYQQHCALCHGVAGDGRGPAGGNYNPHPRDYRKGIFKFVSTQPGEAGKPPSPGRARRADLYGTLVRGIDASGMPSFAGLGDGQLQQLVSYVIFLSLRGEVEGRTISAIVKADPLEDPSAKEVEDYQRQQLHGRTNPEGNKVSFGLIDHWRAAQSSPVEVTPDPYQTPEARTDAAAAGFGLFINDQVGCAKCHINYGRTLNLRYDDWGTIVQPRNILDGRWRGGKDGRDLYVRIAGGIPGSGMPAHAILRPTEDEKRAGVDRLWQVVHFVRMAGNKAQRPKLVEKLKDKGLDPKFDD